MKEKRIGLYMFFFSFLCSAIRDFDLGILNVLQPGVYQFVPVMIWLSASLYSKCTVFRVNIRYLQVLAMYKKVVS